MDFVSKLLGSTNHRRNFHRQSKVQKRAELTAAWRWYVPRPLALPRTGPRPASTYRAARRNAAWNRKGE